MNERRPRDPRDRFGSRVDRNLCSIKIFTFISKVEIIVKFIWSGRRSWNSSLITIIILGRQGRTNSDKFTDYTII